MITLDVKDLEPQAIYFMMTSLVVPRPIAWVSTLSASGKRNLAPYSHFSNCSSNPPIVMFSSTGEKDTLRNIRDTGEFVINVVSDDLKHEMRTTSAEWPFDVDEFEKAQLQVADSLFVKPQRVAKARAAMECRLRTIIPMGAGQVVFGDIICFHVSENIMIDGRVDSTRLQPVGKLDASHYATINTVERLDLKFDVGEQVADYRAASPEVYKSRIAKGR